MHDNKYPMTSDSLVFGLAESSELNHPFQCPQTSYLRSGLAAAIFDKIR